MGALASIGMDGWALILLFLGVGMYFVTLYVIAYLVIGVVLLFLGRGELKKENKKDLPRLGRGR